MKNFSVLGVEVAKGGGRVTNRVRLRRRAVWNVERITGGEIAMLTDSGGHRYGSEQFHRLLQLLLRLAQQCRSLADVEPGRLQGGFMKR